MNRQVSPRNLVFPKALVLLAVAVSSVTACKKSPSTQPGPITLTIEDMMSSEGKIRISDFCNSVDFVVLKPHADWYFPDRAMRIKFMDRYVLFLNRGRNEPVIGVFSRSGDFIVKIDRRGKGPGEYVTVFDFGMNTEETRIWILERSRACLHWYGLSGEWIETIQFPTDLSHVKVLNSGDILAQNIQIAPDTLDKSRLVLVDRTGTRVRSVWDKPANHPNVERSRDDNWAFQSGADIYYRDHFYSDTLYRLDDNLNPRPFLIITRQKKQKNPDYSLQPGQKPEPGGSVQFTHFFVVDNLILVSGRTENPLYFCIDRTTHKAVHSEQLIDDLLGMKMYAPYQTPKSDYLVTQIFLPVYRENQAFLFSSDEPLLSGLQVKLRETITGAPDGTEMILVYYKVRKSG